MFTECKPSSLVSRPRALPRALSLCIAQRKLNHFEDTENTCPNTITFHDFYWL